MRCDGHSSLSHLRSITASYINVLSSGLEQQSSLLALRHTKRTIHIHQPSMISFVFFYLKQLSVVVLLYELLRGAIDRLQLLLLTMLGNCNQKPILLLAIILQYTTTTVFLLNEQDWRLLFLSALMLHSIRCFIVRTSLEISHAPWNNESHWVDIRVIHIRLVHHEGRPRQLMILDDESIRVIMF